MLLFFFYCKLFVAVVLEMPENKTAWSIDDEMEQQQWVATKYEQRPALAALTGMIASAPIPKIFASNAVPFLMWREQGQEAKVNNRKNDKN